MVAEKALLEDLNGVVRNYNGQIAIWNKKGQKGKIPIELLLTISELYQQSEQFIGKYKGSWSD
jgi:hypothetical protein